MVSLPSDVPLSSAPAFADRLVAWQRRHGRHDLPWQQSREPYRVWLSEIMLQQTQVSAVVPYYQRFLERFPTVESLAGAADEAVMAAWAGLGYYARARNLLACARQVTAAHGGVFPASAQELARLPGIGRSTAAAIAAFCFGEPAAILDGNVKRVLCRHFAVEGFPGAAPVERRLWALAESLLPGENIEAYTQGLMDLGATLCLRSHPRCPACPLADTCRAQQTGRQALLPAPRPRVSRPQRRTAMLFITDGRRVLLERRPPNGLWGGLLTPPEAAPQTAFAALAALGLATANIETLPGLRHDFTHFRLHIDPVLCRLDAIPPGVAEGERQWVDLAEAQTAGVPTPVRKLLARLREKISGKASF